MTLDDIPLPANSLLALFFLALVVVAVIKWAPKKYYYRFNKHPILTPNELRFFNQLRRAVPDYYVFPQISMGALLAPAYHRADQRHLYAFRSIAQKRADFVICAATDLAVRCIVELDDSTHNATHDRERDRITAGAGYQTIRIRTARSWNFDDVIRIVYDAAPSPRKYQ
jgi:hypothetical protein